MRSAILQGRTPNLFLLHYQFNPFTVASLMFIPDFAFTLSALECRAPLAVTARRAGWIGCNILLNRSLHKSAFHLADVYALENSLARLHPNNSHIRPQIRQQLQVLRDSVYLPSCETALIS
jgi:type II restriction enzyme